MGCGGSTMPMPPMPNEEPGDMKMDRPSPIAFSVPLTEDEESLVKKHPPKRLRMMQEGPQSPPLTHEMLLEKLAEADQRRQQILSQRIESAKTLMRPRYNSASKTNNADEAIVEHAAEDAEPEDE
ncbi:Protein of unknown function DUF4619 [Cinara cedri]|uniref:Uncharacterized protein n=1 Tax=Cinara cedri TaxID=506608 RepID=A0A5E4N5M4_9HEMI|nr:Protein of unknown function DUF4619 [Cinara cedri]